MHDDPEARLTGRLDRRRALGLLGGAGLAAALAACGVREIPGERGDDDSAPPANDALPAQGGGPPDPTSNVKVGKGETPAETAGQFPGDGTDSRDVLVQKGVVRSDITRSFGGPGGIAQGVPATIALRLLDKRGRKTRPYRGAAVYVWHCDAWGRYSMYDQLIANQNYLRGVQVTDRKGRVTFRSIFPAAHVGRWPHISVEVFRSAESARKREGRLRTTEIALPEKACDEVYATGRYSQSRVLFPRTSLKDDPSFRDGYSMQMADVSGSVDDGMRISLDIVI